MCDLRFWLMLPGLTAPALILTAMFFHHLSVAEAKGWSAAWITGNYLVFSIAMVVTSLIAGPLIDRIGAARLVPLMLVPLAIAMLAIGWGQHQYWVVPYFLLAGASSGLSMTAVAALWPELYGTGHLGAIKSLVASLSVFASALGPVTMGGLMDFGLSIDAICYMFAAATLLGTACMFSAVRFTR
jgi:MFS family permease